MKDLNKNNSCLIDTKFMFISVMFISLMLISNLLACKLVTIFNYTLPAGVFIYPFSFMLGDVLTELYGFKITRKVIWTGFIVQASLVLFSTIALYLPYPSYWTGQEAFKTIFMMTPQIVLGSLLAFLVGTTTNSAIMVKVKKWTKGKFLWIRTVLSTIIGEFFDSLIFVSIAFFGRMPLNAIIQMIILQIIVKTLIEAAFGTPLAYMFINKFKNKKDK
jgi:hypothetical protein